MSCSIQIFPDLGMEVVPSPGESNAYPWTLRLHPGTHDWTSIFLTEPQADELAQLLWNRKVKKEEVA